MSNAIHAHARPIFRATNQPNQNNVIYHQAASPSWATCLLVAGITTCNCGLCHLSEELAKDTYVTVYENKVEYNYPVAAHCCCRVRCTIHLKGISFYISVPFSDQYISCLFLIMIYSTTDTDSSIWTVILLLKQRELVSVPLAALTTNVSLPAVMRTYTFMND